MLLLYARIKKCAKRIEPFRGKFRYPESVVENIVFSSREPDVFVVLPVRATAKTHTI